MGVYHVDGRLVALPPVNETATDLWEWEGPDITWLNSVRRMRGLPMGAHTDRGRIYDGLGWWPYILWVDRATAPPTWYSYMHAEDGVPCDDGNAGLGMDLRTAGVWQSVDEGAHCCRRYAGN